MNDTNATNETSVDKTLSFEDAYRKLETIVASLDSARCGLEDSLASFEEGMKLLKYCRDKLDGASRRIELLKGLDSRGESDLEEMNEGALRSSAEEAGRQNSTAAEIVSGAVASELSRVPSSFFDD